MKHSRGKIFALAVAIMAAVGSLPSFAQMVPQVEKRTIVVEGAGYFPVLVRLQTGRLLVVYRYGAPHISVKGELAVSWSDDNGAKWTKPLVVASGEFDHRNPAMGEMPNGDVVLVYCIMDGYDATGRKFRPAVNGKGPNSTKPLWMVRSKDHGATWSAPEEIEGTRELADRGVFLDAYGKIAVAADASALLSVYGRGENIYRSTDSGHTWSLLSTIAQPVNETAILALPNNHALVAMRTDKLQNLMVSRSGDGGKTWDSPTPVTNPSEHPGDLIQLQNGDVLLTFGERNAPRGVGAIVSHDGGKTWDPKTRMVLADDAPSRDCGYPSSVQLPDGQILTVYYEVQDAATAPVSTSLRAILWKLPKEAGR